MTEIPLDRSPWTETNPLDKDPPSQRPDPVDRMTDACENITLPQTSFAGGNNSLTLNLGVASPGNSESTTDKFG